MRRSAIVAVSVLALTVFGCAGKKPPAATPAAAKASAAAAAPAPQASVADTVRGAMDLKADPCQDFYRYACGTWIDTTPLPPDKPAWGRSFSEINERNRAAIRQILDDAAAKPGSDENMKRLGAYFGACMDEGAIEKRGTKPLEPWLARVAAVRSASDAVLFAAEIHARGGEVFWGSDVLADFKDPDRNIYFVAQGGLGLPDRDYYLKDDEKSVGLRADYVAHVGRMLALSGAPAGEAEAGAKSVLAFETELAKMSRPRQEMRIPEKLYNKLDRPGLAKLAPSVPWDAYFKALGYPEIRDINVATPEFFEGLDKLLAKTDAATLRTYLRWHVVHGTADLLPKAFQDESFDFYGKKLSGAKEIEARWKRCVSATDDALGEAIGRAYVERNFPGDSKAKALDMIQRIEAAFKDNLGSLNWMDDTTRQRALDKLHTLTNKIGYPDKWRDYSALAPKKDAWFEDGLAAQKFNTDFRLKQVGKPVDKTLWGMTPPTVNAYYNPLANEMVFPAGILQEPFFRRDFPPPMNFGAIGMVMGHELTHGYDDEGRKFDPTGKLVEWWEPEVSKRFDERAQCVDDLYSSYEVVPGGKINGRLTLGENIADLGGIKEAYLAWRKYAAEHAQPASYVQGLTNDQLFFVAYAQGWCSKSTDEFKRMMLTINPHSDARFRVIGPLTSLPAFAETFQCKPGSSMAPEKRCEVW